jgi:homoserine kinase type II
MLSKRTVITAAERYNLGEIRSLTQLHGGLQTPKTLVKTTKGTFVISKHNLSTAKGLVHKSRESLSYEIKLLNTLKDLPVPHFVRSQKGRYMEDINNSWVTVDTFIPGKKPHTITPKMAYQIGLFIGDFHTQGKRFKTSLPSRRKFYDLGEGVMKRMYPYAKKQTNPLLKSVLEEVKSGVEKNRLSKNLPRGPVHVDIKPDNELFVGEDLAGVLDFGNFYIDTFLLDVGKAIMWNCVKAGKIDPALCKAFMRGYQERRRLNKQEMKYLTQAIRFAIYSHIWVDLYHVPLRYVPESYTLGLVKKFLPIARGNIAIQ